MKNPPTKGSMFYFVRSIEDRFLKFSSNHNLNNMTDVAQFLMEHQNYCDYTYV